MAFGCGGRPLVHPPAVGGPGRDVGCRAENGVVRIGVVEFTGAVAFVEQPPIRAGAFDLHLSLLDSIDTSTVIGPGDRALIAVMVYSLARVCATAGMRVSAGARSLLSSPAWGTAKHSQATAARLLPWLEK